MDLVSLNLGQNSDMKRRTLTPVQVGPDLDVIMVDGSKIRLTPTEALTLAELLARRAFARMASEELHRSITSLRIRC